jgi:shikimate dehydrogenase
MFDGKGCLEGMRRMGIAIEGAKVMLWGAGGAGCAIADALVEQGAEAVTVHDQDEAKAYALIDVLQASHPGCTVECAGPQLDRHTILINATPVGMALGDGLPGDPGKLTSRVAVVDIIGTPAVTPLLAAAQAAGCRTMGGRTMVESQADAIFSFFLSKKQQTMNRSA